MTPEQRALFIEFSEDMDFWSTVIMACSWYCGGGPINVEASSFLPPKNGNTYFPFNAHDFDLRTAWVEGVEGYGIGEYIEFYFEPLSPGLQQLKYITGILYPWKDYSRVKNSLYVNNKPYAILKLQDSRAVQRFQVEPLQSRDKNKDLVLKFEIMEVLKERSDDVAISEINFDGLDAHCFVKRTQLLWPMGRRALKPVRSMVVGNRQTLNVIP